MLISDALRTKSHHVVRIHTVDSVGLAVRKLAEHRIGALVVEDRWMKPVVIFSERDFINADWAMSRDKTLRSSGIPARGAPRATPISLARSSPRTPI